MSHMGDPLEAFSTFDALYTQVSETPCKDTMREREREAFFFFLLLSFFPHTGIAASARGWRACDAIK